MRRDDAQRAVAAAAREEAAPMAVSKRVAAEYRFYTSHTVIKFMLHAVSTGPPIYSLP